MKMRVAASVAVTVLVTAALAGCQFVTPQQTARSYTPSDGVNGMVGDVDIRNVFVLVGEGDTASVIGVLSNDSDSARDVTLEYTTTSGPGTEDLTVPAGGLLALSTKPGTVDASVPGESQALVLEGVQAKPGGLLPVTFTSRSKSTDLRLPVLTGSQEQYAALVPTPTPTPTRTRRATAEPTDSATPTDGATPDAEIETPSPTPTAG